MGAWGREEDWGRIWVAEFPHCSQPKDLAPSHTHLFFL